MTDRAGNIYVADLEAHQVVMYDRNFRFSRTFGTRKAGRQLGDLAHPQGMAILDDTLYIADYQNNRISYFSLIYPDAGYFLDSSILNRPMGLVASPDGFLWVADRDHHRILKISKRGAVILSVGGLGDGPAQFRYPTDLAIDPKGHLYVTDYANHRIQKFGMNGEFLAAFGADFLDRPDGLAVDASEMLTVVDRGHQRLLRIDPNGKVIAASPYQGTSTGWVDIADVALWTHSNSRPYLFLSDPGRGTVHIVEDALIRATPRYLSAFGTQGNGLAQFQGISAITIDPDGNFYAADYANHRIQKFDQAGVFLQAWGSEGDGAGQFRHPTGLALDSTGALYVVDSDNHRVQVFDTNGLYQREWGGKGSAPGLFNTPLKVTVDKIGGVYITDSGNARIQKFTGRGELIRVITHPNLTTVHSITIDPGLERLFVSNRTGLITTFDTRGVHLGTLAVPGEIEALSADGRGSLYLANATLTQLTKVTIEGVLIGQWGGLGNGEGQFERLAGITADSYTGRLYAGEWDGGRIQAFGAGTPRQETIGVWRPSEKKFLLRNQNGFGAADIQLPVPDALATDLPITGDWNGDGYETPGLFRPESGYFFLWDGQQLALSQPRYRVLVGNPNDLPLAGDWDGNGRDGVGVFRSTSGIFYLKQTPTGGEADYSVLLGNPGDYGVAGDWDGDGVDTVGLYRASERRFYLTNLTRSGVAGASLIIALGEPGVIPVVGDWTGLGYTGIGYFNSGSATFFLRPVFTDSAFDLNFPYGSPEDIPLAGTWWSGR
jgi:DNA-binding beta-propeller fold protein YncE